MSKKIYFYTEYDTYKTLKDITEYLFYENNENSYIWDSNKNIDKITNNFWLSNNYSSPRNKHNWYIPIILKDDLDKVKVNEENIKYITWNVTQNEIKYKITLIDFTNKYEDRGFVMVVTLHYHEQNYAYIYESPYFTFENVYSKKEQKFKDVLFFKKSSSTSWINSINTVNIHNLLKETTRQKNFIYDIKSMLSKLITLKYKTGVEHSNKKDFNYYCKINPKDTNKLDVDHDFEIFSHYRQLTHFTKQPYWNKYEDFIPNSNLVNIINGMEVPLLEPYHPIQIRRMNKMKNIKSHEELQEDLFNAWQTPIFTSDPYK